MEPELQELCAKGPLAVFDFIWASHYVPQLEAKIRDEAARRADAFADGITFTCCDEELRVMTQADLVQLDGMDNPLIVGGDEPSYADVAYLLWYLNAQNNPAKPLFTSFRKGRFTARFKALVQSIGLDACIDEVHDYLDRIFIDLTPPATTKPNGEPIEQKPPAVHCVAPLLVDVASILGPFDPMTGKTLGQSPIPRLIQYQRAHANAKADVGSFDSARSRCLEDVNNLMAEYRNLSKG